MRNRDELTLDDLNPGTIYSGRRCSEFCPYLHRDDIQTQGYKDVCVLFRHPFLHCNWPPPRCWQCRTMYPHGAGIEVKAKTGSRT